MDEKKIVSDTKSKETDDVQAEVASVEKVFNSQQDNLIYDNSYQLEPNVYFNAEKVDSLIGKLLESELKEFSYDSETAKDKSLQIAKNALSQVKSLGYPRYKLICVVQIGDMKVSPSIISCSRSLWNKATDNYSTAQYSNNTLYALLLVFGVYKE